MHGKQLIKKFKLNDDELSRLTSEALGGSTTAELDTAIGKTVTALAPNKIVTLLNGIFLPLRFLFERICWRDPEVFRQWDLQLAARHPFTPVGGDDAHANVRLLGPLGGTIGNYQEVFLTLSTHVLAPRLTEADLVQALKLGRTYVSFDIFGEGAGFDFRAVDRDGVHVGGATVAAADDLRLCVHTPQPGGIQLWRDGAVVREVDGDALEEQAPAPGVYRVEVRTRYGSPWLFSSSIKVTPAATSGGGRGTRARRCRGWQPPRDHAHGLFMVCPEGAGLWVRKAMPFLACSKPRLNSLVTTVATPLK